MATLNVEYQHSVVDPLDATNVWTYKIVENMMSEFSFTEIQNRNGFLLPTALVPEFVLEDMVQKMEQHSGQAIARFEKYELLLSGTYQVTDPDVSPATGTKEGEIESGKSYLIVIVTAPVASVLDLGSPFDQTKLLIVPATPLADYLDTNFAGDELVQAFEFVYGTSFSADASYVNAQIQALLNDIYVFVDKRGNVYSAFQGSGLQGGHWCVFRENQGF